MASTTLDRVASVAFAAFVYIEWAYSNNQQQQQEAEFAWRMRLAWFFASCLAAILASRSSHTPLPPCQATSSSLANKPLTRATSASIAAVVEPLLLSSASSAEIRAAPLAVLHQPEEQPPQPAYYTTVQPKSSSSSLRSRLSFSKRKQQPLQSSLSAPGDLDTSLLSNHSSGVDDGRQGSSSPLSRSFTLRPSRILFGRRSSSSSSKATSQSMSALHHNSSQVPTAVVVAAYETQLPVAAVAVTVAAAPPPPPMVLDRFGFGPEAVKPPADFVYVREDNWGYPGHLSAEQAEALRQMQLKQFACRESEHNSSGNAYMIDEACLLRFLRARKFDVDKAERMLRAHLVWRDKFMPRSLTPSDVSHVLGSGVARFGPYSKQGQPVIIIKVGNFDPSAFPSLDDFTKYCAFFFERGIAKFEASGGGSGENDKAVLFFDMNGWSLRRHATPYSMKLTGELLNVIQAHNPERLSKCVLFNTPALFQSSWKIIKQWIDPVVVNKIQFVGSRDAHLVRDLVSEDALPREYGGTRDLPYPIEGYAELHPSL